MTNEEQRRNPSDESGPQNDAVKQALKKEGQPARPEDLSPLHDNHQVGSSGGDQREPDKDVPEPKNEGDDQQPGKPVRPIPVEEPGEGSAPKVEYDEPDKKPSENTSTNTSRH